MTFRRTVVAANVASFAIVALAALGFQCAIRCSLGTQGTWLKMLAGLGLALAGSIGLRKTWFFPGATIAAILTVLILGRSSYHLPAECCGDCFSPDGDRIGIASTLLKGEEDLVLNENFTIFDMIYDSNAKVTNVETGVMQDARTHYTALIDGMHFFSLIHATPLMVLTGATADEFKVSTISFGGYTARGTSEQTLFQGIDLWTIGRNETCGCWKIKAFSYNVNRVNR